MNLRPVLIVFLLGALFAGPGLSVAAQTPAADQSPDLPAMTLTPADLDALGLPGYGRYGNGKFRSLDDYVVGWAALLNKPETEVRAAFADAGWQRGYLANLGLPADPGNPDTSTKQEAFSVVHEFADADGAAAAYEFNQDFAGVADGVIEVIAGARSFADASYMVSIVLPDPEVGGPSGQIDITLRRGNIVASTGLNFFGDSSALATPAAPEPKAIAQVEAMATRLLERIEGVLAGQSPSLSNRTLRLDAGDPQVAFSTEGYRRLNGDDPPYYNGYQDDFPGDAFTDVVAAYELNQVLQVPGDPYYVVRLLDFATPHGAASYVEGVRDQGLSPAGTAAELVADAATVGDDSLTMQYTAEFEPGQPIAGIAVYAQVGTTAFMLLLEAAEQPNLATVEALAVAQAACLDGEACPGSTPVPSTLFAATPAA